MYTVGIDEARVRMYIQEQQENDRLEDESEPDNGNPYGVKRTSGYAGCYRLTGVNFNNWASEKGLAA